jgi:hypothetical protein
LDPDLKILTIPIATIKYTGDTWKDFTEDTKKAIQKGIHNQLEQARRGIYENTEENRKLGRVGQKYGLTHLSVLTHDSQEIEARIKGIQESVKQGTAIGVDMSSSSKKAQYLQDKLNVLTELKDRNFDLSFEELNDISNQISKAKSIEGIEILLLKAGMQKVYLHSSFNVNSLKESLSHLFRLCAKYEVNPGQLSITSSVTTNGRHIASVSPTTIVSIPFDKIKETEVKLHFPNDKIIKDINKREYHIFANVIQLTLNVKDTGSNISWFSHTPEFINKQYNLMTGLHSMIKGSGIEALTTHEFGHILQDVHFSREQNREVAKDKNSPNAVSGYAKESGLEAEAEAFVMYNNGDRSEKVLQSLSRLLSIISKYNEIPIEKSHKYIRKEPDG